MITVESAAAHLKVDGLGDTLQREGRTRRLQVHSRLRCSCRPCARARSCWTNLCHPVQSEHGGDGATAVAKHAHALAHQLFRLHTSQDKQPISTPSCDCSIRQRTWL